MRLAERSRSGHRSISKEVAARNMHVRILLSMRIFSSYLMDILSGDGHIGFG